MKLDGINSTNVSYVPLYPALDKVEEVEAVSTSVPLTRAEVNQPPRHVHGVAKETNKTFEQVIGENFEQIMGARLGLNMPGTEGRGKLIVSRQVFNQTNKLLDQAYQLASAVDKPIVNGSQNHKKSCWSSWNVFIFSSHSGFSSSNGHSDGTRVLIGLIAVIIGVATSVFLGKMTAANDNYQQKKSAFLKQVDSWQKNEDSYKADPYYQKKLNKVIKFTKSLITLEENRLFNAIYKIAVPLLVCSGLLLAGALIGGTAGVGLVSAGALVGAGVAFYSLFKFSRENHSTASKNLVNKIITNIKFLDKVPMHVRLQQAYA